MLHGYGGNGARTDRSWGISALADKYNYLAIALDGEREVGGRQSPFWNASDACCNFEDRDVDDSGYIRRVIDQIKASYNVDGSRVYVVGHSNGGFMSYVITSYSIHYTKLYDGGVNLDVKDPVLARTLLDLSQTATISDSLKLGKEVLNELGGINRLHKPHVEQAGFAVLKAPDIPSIRNNFV